MDLILRHASIGADGPVDVAVRGAVEIDAEGRLVLPTLVEPHLHLDAVLTEGEPRHNVSGLRFEGIEIWAERVKGLTAEDIQRRADRALRWLLAHGVCAITKQAWTGSPTPSGYQGSMLESWPTSSSSTRGRR